MASGGLTIAVDGRALAGGPGRGIAHYLRALLRAWPAPDALRVVVPRGAGADVAADLVGHVRRASLDQRADPRFEIVEHDLPGRLPYATGAALGAPRLGGDVAWLPAPAPVAVRAPYVLTVHDRSWEARPDDFTRYERAWHAAARPRAQARGAARVLTTTRWGREDLIAAWSLDPARVTAVPLAPVVVPAEGRRTRGATDQPSAPAADPARRSRTPGLADRASRAAAAGRGPLPDGGPYVLFVGALEPRKGPDVLAEAIAAARPRGFDARVVVAGSGRLEGVLRATGVEHVAGATDAELSALYAGARALVVPSRLEGFGLPALEALAHGTPVVATELPPVREVLGDAARYVAAGDAAGLAAALLDLPDPPPAAPPLAGRTWADVARETRAALVQAARSRDVPAAPSAVGGRG